MVWHSIWIRNSNGTWMRRFNKQSKIPNVPKSSVGGGKWCWTLISGDSHCSAWPGWSNIDVDSPVHGSHIKLQR